MNPLPSFAEGFGVVVLLAVAWIYIRSFPGRNPLLRLRLALPQSRESLGGFYRYVSKCLRDGDTLSEILEGYTPDDIPLWVKKMISRLRKQVTAGVAFSVAAESERSVFLPSEISMLRAGEAHGTLADAFDCLALRTTIRKGGDLPELAILFEIIFFPPMICVAAWLMLVPIISAFADIYAQLGADLPFLTQLLMDMYYYTVRYGSFVILIIVGILLLFREVIYGRVPFIINLRRGGFLVSRYWPGVLNRVSTQARLFCLLGMKPADALHEAFRTSGNAILIKGLPQIEEATAHGTSLEQAIANVTRQKSEIIQFWFTGFDQHKPGADGILGNIGILIEIEAASIWPRQIVPSFLVLFYLIFPFIVIALYLPLFNLPRIVGKD